MDVDQHVERLGGLEDLPVLRLVEVLALRVRVDHRALKPSEIARCSSFTAAAGSCEAIAAGGVACGYCRVFPKQPIVQSRGSATASRRRIPDAPGGEEHELLRDPGCVHVGEALRAEILDAPHELRRARRRAEEKSPQAAEAGIRRRGWLLEELPIARE